MSEQPPQVTVDANSVIARLREQAGTDYGRMQIDLAIARAEADALRESERVLRELLAETHAELADMRAADMRALDEPVGADRG